MRTRILFALMVALILPTAAAAQDASVAFDSAFAPAGVNPGITVTAPLFAGADLYAHTGIVSVGDNHVDTQATHAGVRFRVPASWRVQPFVNVGISHLRGTVGYDDLLAVKLQPGVRYYVHESWGFEFRTPAFHVADVIEANPYDRHTRAVVSLFGSF